MGPTFRPETSVANYQPTRRKIPKVKGRHLHHGGRLVLSDAVLSFEREVAHMLWSSSYDSVTSHRRRGRESCHHLRWELYSFFKLEDLALFY
jgi:hypothetical protein